MSDKIFNSLDDLLAASGHTFVEVDVPGGKAKLRPVTIQEIVMTARRFPALEPLIEVLNPFAEEAPAEEEDKAAEKAKADKDENKPTAKDAILNAGPEAAAALIACAWDRPGCRETEAKAIGAPDRVWLALALGAVRITLGKEGISGFFTVFNQLADMAGDAMKEIEATEEAA